MARTVCSCLLLLLIGLPNSTISNETHNRSESNTPAIARDVGMDCQAPSTSIPLVKPNPRLFAVLLDFTLSVDQYGLHLPAPEQLKPLIRYTVSNGGELGVGAIQENSGLPLLRLRIEPPQAPPPEPPRHRNVLINNRRRAKHAIEMDAYQAKETERREEAATKVKVFCERLQLLLSRSADDKVTDVFGNLRRANRFLMESQKAWDSEVPLERILLLHTDGEDTSGSTFFQPDSSIIIVLVNGSAGLGDLAQLNPAPITFEGFDAAVDFIQHL